MILSSALVFAQDADTEIIDDPFADAFLDPFADPDEIIEESGDADPGFEDPFAVDEEGKEPDEDAISFDDFDSMFDTDSMVEEIDEEEAAADTGSVDEFLISDGVEFGGSFSGTLSSSFNYDYLWTEDFDITDPEQAMTPSVSADLFFDARPEADYRVFGKLGFTSASGNDQNLAALIPEGGLTFQTGTDDDGNTTFTAVDDEDVDPDDPDQTTVTQEDAEDAQGDTSTALNISVKELFADFDWDDKLYFRFGKSFIKWGIGYFWSPADVLNLSGIDVEDPTAEREGPLSFKMHYPFDINNAYLYVITENVEEPLDTALASKVEFVIGNTEFGAGAYYQRDLAPRAVATVSTTIGDFAVFGEGVASWGSDRVFVRPAKDQSAAEEDEEDDLELVLDSYEVSDRPFFSATVGTNYMHAFENDAGSLMLIGQYFFNGEGYNNDEPGLLQAASRLSQNAGENGLALDAADQPENYEDPPAVDTGDLTNFGRHYAGAMIAWNSIFDSDLSFSTLAISNFTDLSGMVMPTFSYRIMDYISISAGMRMTFGEEGDEYTNPMALLGLGGSDAWKGSTVSFSLDCSIGGGSF
ncbi:MAG TPA: hypothetical protein DCO79_03385 [Spirochaeta sp.]|nr:hypothetical protein [Spirochaeta sp.]